MCSEVAVELLGDHLVDVKGDLWECGVVFRRLSMHSFVSSLVASNDSQSSFIFWNVNRDLVLYRHFQGWRAVNYHSTARFISCM